MNKKTIAKAAAGLVFTAAILSLSGCAAPVEDALLQASGSLSEEEYQHYQELRDSGQLDQEGQYIAAELEKLETLEPSADKLHITFARNAYLTVSYYADPVLETPIDPERCYLEPGTSVYCVAGANEDAADWYDFDHFEAFRINGSLRKNLQLSTKQLEIKSESGDNVIQLVLPDDDKTKELSIVPAGRFKKRKIKLIDSYEDSAGNRQDPNGQWFVNDEEVYTSNIEVRMVDTIRVDYRYDEEKYSYSDATKPSSYYHEKGLIYFEKVDARSNIDEFNVCLSVKGKFTFDPEEFQSENGVVHFTHNGEQITEKTDLWDGQEIQYSLIPNKGYTVKANAESGTIRVNSSDEEAIRLLLEDAIQFYPEKKVRVHLPRPTGGTINYSVSEEDKNRNELDSTKLEEDNYELKCGTQIIMEFEPCNGWSCKADGEETYTVREEAGVQEVSIASHDDDIHIDNIYKDLFIESDSRRPTVSIVLKENAKDVNVDLTGPDIEDQKNLIYTKEAQKTNVIPDWLGQTDRIIYEGQIGTYEPMYLTPANGALLPGYALKMEITKTDKQDNKETEVRYIRSLPADKKVTEINFYPKNDFDTSKTIYETIRVIISKVEASEVTEKDYKRPDTINHATLAVTLRDNTTAIKLGDLLETDQTITVTVTPEAGYYVRGSETQDGIYRETMKYSKWVKNSDNFIKEHQTAKLWYVILDASDPYGTCVYKLDGEEVEPGRIGVREDQELTLEYALTSEDYEIVRSGVGGFWGNLVHSDTESCNIPISAELDGKTIRRGDYIKVERKGN